MVQINLLFFHFSVYSVDAHTLLLIMNPTTLPTERIVFLWLMTAYYCNTCQAMKNLVGFE